jgi:hypothetical protein
MPNITIIYERNACQFRLKYTWLREMNGKRPCKSNRSKERANILDDFDHCVIKRAIHGLYSRKIAPTVSLIHKEIKDSIKNFLPNPFYKKCKI